MFGEMSMTSIINMQRLENLQNMALLMGFHHHLLKCIRNYSNFALDIRHLWIFTVSKSLTF